MIKADKDIVITITGKDVEKLEILIELARRYEGGMQRQINTEHNLFDEYNWDEIKCLRNTMDELFQACK